MVKEQLRERKYDKSVIEECVKSILSGIDLSPGGTTSATKDFLLPLTMVMRALQSRPGGIHSLAKIFVCANQLLAKLAGLTLTLAAKEQSCWAVKRRHFLAIY